MSVVKYIAKSNEEWRAERAHSIGASAVGTLIGDNPFQTPYQLAQRMRAELQGNFDYTQTLPMMRGHAYEQGVADLFQWQTGHQVIKTSSREYLLRRDDLPFMHASPDRTYWIDENGAKHGKNAELNKGILECKTTRRPIDPDNLPLSWMFQLQVQLGISGYKEGYIAWDVLSNPDGFGYQQFNYDEEVFQAAVEVCREFWHNCIEQGNDPAPVSAADIVAKFPQHIEGKTITASVETKQQLADLTEMKQTAKELKDEIDTLSDHIKCLFEDAEAIVDLDGHVLATYRTSKPRASVDTKRLQTDYPDIYTALLKESAPSRTLLVK